MEASLYYSRLESLGKVSQVYYPGVKKSKTFLLVFSIFMLFSISALLLWSTNYGIWKLGYDRVLSFFSKAPTEDVGFLNHEYNNDVEIEISKNNWISKESILRPPAVVNPQMEVSSIFIYHTVSPGETLWNIARSFEVGIDGILALNPQIKNPNLIFPGMKIKIASR